MPTKKDVMQTESVVEGASPVITDQLYADLSAEFDITHKRPIGGGRILDYITKEQAITRMNTVVGFRHWNWEIVRTEQIGDEVVVRGRMTLFPHTQDETYKDASGGFKPRQGMSWGDATKAAESDAFKKAAMYFGVALYLAEKSGEGVAELPYAPQSTGQYNAGPTVSALPSVKFPSNTSASGTEISGVVTAKSQDRNSLLVNGEWYKLAGRSVSQYQALFNSIQTGQAVSIIHPEGMTFINGLKVVDTQVPVGVAADEEDALAF